MDSGGRESVATVVRGAGRSGVWVAAGAAVGGALLGLTSGALGASGAFGASGASGGGPVAAWLADRDGGAVVGLDRERLVVRRIALESPVELALGPDGDLWVACAGAAGPVGPHRLLLVEDESGRIERELALGPVLDLESIEGGSGAVLAVEFGSTGARQVVRVSPTGAVTMVERSEDAFCAAAAFGCTLVGSERGELRLFGPDGQRLARRDFGGVLSDLAPGPESGTWWVLDAAGGAGGTRLALLGRDLAPRWVVPAGLAALTLTPVREAERVWLCDGEGALVRRFGPGGSLELAHIGLAHVGASRASVGNDGSVWIAAPGALLCLDAAGGSVPGQGGFGYLVDVECVR